MYHYSKLTHADNVLVEIYNSGPIGSKDVAIMLNIDYSTGSNILRALYGKRYLTRENINKNQKYGGPEYLYDLGYDGTRRVEWLMKNRASALA